MNNVELACLLAENNKLKVEIAKLQTRNDRKYKLIETITVSEDDIRIISRTQEPDGTEYNYEKIIVKSEIKQGTYTGQIRCRVNGEMMSAATWIKQDSGCYSYARFNIENGLIIPIFTSSATSASAALADYSSHKFMASMFLNSITDFQIEAINLDNHSLSEIPVGSVFKIYAVRSE